MMRKINVIIICLIILYSTGNCGELVVQPTIARSGETINLKYVPDGRYFLGEDISAQVYTFTRIEPQATAYEFPLKFDIKEQNYNNSFTVPENVVYLIIKISNGKIIDNNKDEFWYIFFQYDNKPIQGSYLKAGITFLGNQPENMSRNVDYKKAMDYLKKETILFPNNIQAQVGYTSLLLDLQKIDFKKYSELMEKILKKNYDKTSENDIRAVSRALKTLNKKEESEKIELDFAKAFPQSQLAEEIFMADLAKANSLDKFSDGILEYLKKFPVNNNRERIYSALVSGYLQAGKSEEVVEILNKKEDVPPGAYAQIAFALINNEEFADVSIEKRGQRAINLMNIAIFSIKKNNIKFKPNYITQKEWEIRNAVRYAGLLEEYGQILMALSENEEAYKKYSEAMEYYKDEAPVSLYENIIELCKTLGKHNAAYETAGLAIKNSKDTDVIIDAFGELHKELNKPDEFNSMLVKMKNEAAFDRIRKLSYIRKNKDFDKVEMKDLSGNKFDLKDMNGKVITLQFWSSWCGPCEEALSGLNELAESFGDSSNVFVASINLWETDEDKVKLVKNYFEESDVKFKKLLDLKNAMPIEFGISGLPVTVFIGRTGKLEFIESGYTNADEFLLNSKDKINFLLNN